MLELSRLEPKAAVGQAKRRRAILKDSRTLTRMVMAAPAVIWLLLFAYVPMFGLIIAFKDYRFDLGIFKSQQVFPLILLIAMAHQRRYEVARDDEVLCDLVEDYAALGCGEMTELLRLNSSEVFHLVLAELMAHHCDARPARASATS